MSEPVVLEAAAAAAPEGQVAAPVVAAAGTPAAATPATPAVESYTLTLPDGAVISPDALARITETAKALKVAPTDAEKLVALANTEASEVIKTYEAARLPDGAIHKALVAQYEQESLKHPQLGNGDPLALEKKAHQAGLVFAEYAPELLSELKRTGWAARAEVILMGARLYEAMGEKSLVQPSSTAQPRAPVSLYPDGIPLDTGAVAAP